MAAEHKAWFEANTRHSESTFQRFLRHYYGTGNHLEQSLNRFALTVFLVDKLVPRGGNWYDAGLMGHDAIRVRLVRPDINLKLAVFEGCAIYLDSRAGAPLSRFAGLV